MLSGNMLELIRDLPKELKRHFYATNLDTKTHGRLDQVNRQFRQFGSDVEIWKMRIRKLLPGIYMPEKQSLLDYIIFYRTIVAIQEFKAFVQSARRYIEITADDSLVHKKVVRAVNGLREYLELERKRIPGDILFEADRRECQFFGGYDPNFDGDEPPGL